ncbi:MAG: hypothetical protein KDB03_19230 [Planctomycetales bacterium]|nr:hypothetical protein [Planctomycetales bacterium]
MRWFSWSLMLVGALAIGCNKPVEDTIPTQETVTETSGMSGSADSHAGHEHAEGEHDHGADGHAEHAEGAAENSEEATSAETPAAEEGAAGTEAAEQPASTDSTSNTNAAIRFVADTKLRVPTMMCPYSCWPKVKETLAAQPGVEGVQLASQEKETEIDNPVVELKLNGKFDVSAAIAALKKVDFDGAEVIN